MTEGGMGSTATTEGRELGEEWRGSVIWSKVKATPLEVASSTPDFLFVCILCARLSKEGTEARKV